MIESIYGCKTYIDTISALNTFPMVFLSYFPPEVGDQEKHTYQGPTTWKNFCKISFLF